MSGAFRIPTGGRIDRSHPIEFQFDGEDFLGLQGDTIASALLAHGVRLFGRSIKFRRPRGVLSCGPEEPNALVTLGSASGGIPNVPATLTQLAPGLTARSQNRWPSLRFDLSAWFGVAGGLYGAGFYYKTFMWPSWRWYEPLIRRLAGLGAAPERARTVLGSERHLDCDVLVVGAGPAGLAAALRATAEGARVILCEQDRLPGGELQHEAARIAGLTASQWVEQACAQLRAAQATLLCSTTVIGAYDGRLLALRRRDETLAAVDELLCITPRVRIIACGAVERPIAFADNDRPGVMLLGSVERYAARFAVRAGNEAVIFGNHDRLYPAALRLASHGVRIRAIVDPRPRPALHALGELERLGTSILNESVLERARGTTCVRGARVRMRSGEARELACDLIAVSGGWIPATALALQSGLEPHYDAQIGAFTAAGADLRVLVAGSAAGQLELSAALAGGWSAGERAARELQVSARATQVSPHALLARTPSAEGDPAPNLQPFWRVPRAREKHQFVDLQNDVTVADLRQAVAEGFREIEHVKRYTTLGVGTEQGRTGGLLGAAIVAQFLGEPLSGVGQSRARPPVRPVPVGVLAGMPAPRTVKPLRRTPLHDLLIGEGAVMEPSALWLRARHFAGHGADAAAAGVAEARVVRVAGGLFDASTLGKIELSGPDAGAFLDRLCLGRSSRIAVGRMRYAVLLREDGMVLDDGLLVRLAEEHFLLTTSTHGASAILAHAQYHIATSASALDVCCADVTEAWGVIVVTGPRSRDLLSKVLPQSLATRVHALGHLAWVAGEWQDRPLRVLRASFSGELGFELHCAADAATSLWRALRSAGAPHGVLPYGLEALDVLRIEKGYLTSAEITGQTSPYDLRLDALVHASADCVGRSMLNRPGLHEPTRPMLVGLIAVDSTQRFNAGAQLIAADTREHSLGYVTSAVWSPMLGRQVALGLLARTHAQPGARVLATDPLAGIDTPLTVTAPVHLDELGARMRS